VVRSNYLYLHPDGPIAVETLRVIGAAMAEAGVVGHSAEVRSLARQGYASRAIKRL
jgi:hypothetical protein